MPAQLAPGPFAPAAAPAECLPRHAGHHPRHHHLKGTDRDDPADSLAGHGPAAEISRATRALRPYRVVIRTSSWTVCGPSSGIGCGVEGWRRFTRAGAERTAVRKLAKYLAGR
jgi:hypothetical protein